MTYKQVVFTLATIGFLIYFNSFFNGFVWDDEEQVLNNVLVHSIFNIRTFFSSSTFNSGGGGGMSGLYYKPLMTTFFSLIYTIFGASSFFFHLFQVMLHMANSILVFLIFKHFFKKISLLPFILSLIFLIHPLNSEAVVYISDLQDILFFFFGALALYLIIQKELDFKNIFLASTLLLCSLLSKETGAIFIALVGVYLSIYKRNELVKFLPISFMAVGIYSLLRFAVAGIYFNKHELSPITVMPLSERILNIPKIIFSYLKTFVYPKDLAINQHWVVRAINFPEFFLPLLVIIFFFAFLAVLGVILLKKDSKNFLIFLFFFCWFTLGLGVHLHLFPLDLTYSDRWFYSPMVGLLGMIGIGVSKFKIQSSRQRRDSPKAAKLKVIFFCLICLIIFGFSIRTIIRNTNWKDGLTLYSHDIKISKDSFDLENNLGVELYRAGKYDQAKVHFEASGRLAPHWWTNWNNLGVISEKEKNFQKAEEFYQKAIDNGQYYLAYENLAKLLLFHQDPTKASQFCQKALKRFPQNANLWLFLAIASYKVGEKDQALQAAKNSYQLSSNQENFYVYRQLSDNLPLEIPSF